MHLPASPVPVPKLARALCGVAFNSQLETLAVGIAINADVPALPQTSGDGWLMLAPYGETEYWQNEGGQLRKYAQVFQRDQAQKMVAAFNVAWTKRGTNFRGLPIYAGHPDVDPQRWPDDRRRGSVQAMEARADGLYVKAALERSWTAEHRARLSGLPVARVAARRPHSEAKRADRAR